MEDYNQSIALVLPALFLLVAMATKKDLAVVAASLSWIGVIIMQGGHQYTIELMMILTLNSSLAIVAAAYNKIRQCNLSIVVALLALGQAFINLMQMFSASQVYGIMTSAVELSMLACLIFMDGRKELIRGMVENFSSFAKHRVFHHIGQHNNKSGT